MTHFKNFCNKVIVCFFIAQLSIFSIKAQITIGSLETPKAGAILDLKENDNLGANSTKGLMLPRVFIKDFNSLDDFGDNLDPLEHIGLMVYSVSEMLEPGDHCASINEIDNQIHKGIYIWDGTQWQILGLKQGEVGVGDELVPPSWLAPGVGMVSDIEGNVYFTMDFGPTAGVWMTQNMRSKTFDTEAILTGVTIAPSAPTTRSLVEGVNDRSTAYYAYPIVVGETYNPNKVGGNSAAFFDAKNTIGLLYNKAGAIGDGRLNTSVLPGGATIEKSQGICPNGWYVPTVADYQALRTEITGNYTKYVEIDPNNSNSAMYQSCTVTTGVSNPTDYPGLSKVIWKGGFALNYVGYIWSGAMSAPAFDYEGTMLWTSSTSTNHTQNNGIGTTAVIRTYPQ